MKKILTIAGILITSFASAQYAPMTAYGYKYKRLMADSTLHIPNFCGVPTLQDTTTKKAAIAFDSCNNRLYFYNPKTFTWGYFSGSGWDSTTVYQVINNLISYIYDTSFTNQFMPAGILLDTTYFVSGTQDSVRAYVYTDGTVVYDTLGRSLLTSITNNITNILTLLDSARSDTSFYISTILNGDTLLKVRHDPNSRNDTVFFAMVPSNPTRDGYMPKEAWALYNNGQEGIISGGRVTWLSGYTYNVSEAYYRIDSVIYHSLSTDITLAAADPTDDRIDLFLLTTSNTAVALTGTAGSGIPPDFDANLNIEASFALVTANTIEPPGVVSNFIYKENVEWTTAVSGASINPNSTQNPYAGSKNIQGTAVPNNAYITFTSPAGLNIGLYNTLTFQIRSKANWTTTRKIYFRWFSAVNNATGNGVPIGSGSYGFVSTNTTAYQTITIPLSDFGNISTAQILRITETNTSGLGGWYIDNIQLQNITGTNTGKSVIFYGKNSTRDSTILTLSDGTRFAAKDSTGGATISLTTTGTSGAATLVGSTLNIPQYSTEINGKVNISDTAAMLSPYLKKLNITAGAGATLTGSGTDVSPYVIGASGGGSGITKAQPPLIVNGAGDTISRRFNVRDYGATGDSTQDATPHIQAAINACISGGGGDVFFPNGIYSIKGALVTSENGVNPNSQLYIPPVYVAPARTHIRFIGETAPNFTPASLYVDTTYSRQGVILKSTIAGSGSVPSVFGGLGDFGGTGLIFTFHYVTFENISLYVKANAGASGPTMTGINGQNFASLRVNNCIVGIDTSLFRDTIPLNETAGIITTKVSGEGLSSVSNTKVYGFRYGVMAGEHCNLDNVFVDNCYASYVFQKNSVSAYARKITSHWSNYDVLIPNSTIMGIISGPCNVKIDLLNVETYTVNPRWFTNVVNVKDSGNNATGQIFYSVTNSGGSAVDYTQTLGTNLRSIPATNTSIRPSPLYVSNNRTTTTGVEIKKGDGINSDRAIGINDASFKNVGTSGNTIIFNPVTSGSVVLSGGNSLIARLTSDSIGRVSITADTSTANPFVAKFFTPNLVTNQKSYVSFGRSTSPNEGYYWAYNHDAAATNSYLSLQSNTSNPGTNSFTITTTNGNVGVGTITPATKFSVVGNFRDSGNINVIGLVGIGTTATPAAPLHINSVYTASRGQFSIQGTGTGNASISYMSFYDAPGTRLATQGLAHYASGSDPNWYWTNEITSGGYIFRNASADVFTIANNGATRMHFYGAGTATFDASGNITSVSDERLKTSIKPYKTGLKELMNINPITYKWDKKSGNETEHTYAGFSAQNVKANIPFGTGENDKGYLSLQDRALLGAAINAIKELNEKIIRLETEIKSLKSK